MYYVFIGNEAAGPYSVEEIAQLLQSGEISPEVLAVPEGSEDWVPLNQLIRIETGTPQAPRGPLTAGPQRPDSAEMRKPRPPTPTNFSGKGCPFCRSSKVKKAPRRYQPEGMFQVRTSKTCQRCDAVWMPSVGKTKAITALVLISLLLIPAVVVSILQRRILMIAITGLLAGAFVRALKFLTSKREAKLTVILYPSRAAKPG